MSLVDHYDAKLVARTVYNQIKRVGYMLGFSVRILPLIFSFLRARFMKHI